MSNSTDDQVAEPIDQFSESPSGLLTRFRESLSVVLRRVRLESLGSVGLSLLIHVAIILILASLVVQSNGIGKSLLMLIASVESKDLAEDVSTIAALAPNQEIDLQQSEDLNLPVSEVSLDSVSDVALPEMMEISPESNDSSDSPLLDSMAVPDSKAPKTSKKRPKSVKRFLPTISKKGTSVQKPLMTDPREGVKQAETVTSVVDGLASQLKVSVEASGKDPVWVVWIMDASLSLYQERQVLAPQLEELYEQFARQDKEFDLKLQSAILAFGSTTLPVRIDRGNPTPKAISGAVSKLPVDDSGIENVLSAVMYAIAHVPIFNRPPRIEIVIWTDESGDDLAMLEDVIQICQARRARVHVVGPLSVFGMEPGLQKYQMPKPFDYSLMLPVKRGPDSAFPERTQLPMWFDSRDTIWDDQEIIPALGSHLELGGPHRKRLLAMTGPYGLTRLALATGGTFTALRRDGDLASPMGDRYKEYLPDYRSGLEIAVDIDKYPLRRAIIEASALSGTVNYSPPCFDFPTSRNPEFPFQRVYSGYMTPLAFQQQLEDQLLPEVRRLEAARNMIEQAIEIMLMKSSYDDYSQSTGGGSKKFVARSYTSSDEFQLPDAYFQEKSPRWKAWYDLNLGRLLAHSVRIAEYRLLVAELLSPEVRERMLEEKINRLSIDESKKLRGGSDCEIRENLAKEILNRVMTEHQDTPWRLMAKWELDTNFGLSYQGVFVPPPTIVVPSRPRVFVAPPIPRL